MINVLIFIVIAALLTVLILWARSMRESFTSVNPVTSGSKTSNGWHVIVLRNGAQQSLCVISLAGEPIEDAAIDLDLEVKYDGVESQRLTYTNVISKHHTFKMEGDTYFGYIYFTKPNLSIVKINNFVAIHKNGHLD